MMTQRPRRTPDPAAEQSGFALVLVLGTLVPAVLLVGVFSSVLMSRTDALGLERAREKALHAAESGVDFAIFLGRRGLLLDGSTHSGNLAVDTSWSLVATHLLYDGHDNDNDGFADEPDEDVFQVVVTGRYRNQTRRLAAYLGPVPLMPDVRAAMAISNPSLDFRIGGSAQDSGFDIDGSGDVPGLAIFQPGTLTDLLGMLTPAEGNRILGPGGTPSLGTVPPIDLTDVTNIVQNVADTVLTSSHYSNLQFGNAAIGDARLTYRNGDLKLTGTSRGAGILVVTGNLVLTGNLYFDGIIIVLGNIDSGTGSTVVRGALVQGPAAAYADLRGNFDLQYSSAAIDLARSSAGLYVAFNGWQELSR